MHVVFIVNLVESYGSLSSDGWLKVTRRLTACTPVSAPGPTLGNEYDVIIVLSVWLTEHTEHSHVSGATCPNFTKFSVQRHIACSRGSVLLWWHRNTLCSSGFVDDVIFSSDPIAAWRYRSRIAAMSCTSWHPCCMALVASCPRRRRAPGLDESFVQGTPGRIIRVGVLFNTVAYKPAWSNCACPTMSLHRLHLYIYYPVLPWGLSLSRRFL